MPEDCVPLDEQRAQQLVLRLQGQAVPDPDDEVTALIAFAQSLPWKAVQPSAEFVVRLRRALFKRKSTLQPLQVVTACVRGNSMPWVLGILLVIIAVIVIPSLLGPQIREMFGTIYNSLNGGSSAYHPAGVTVPATQVPRATARPASLEVYDPATVRQANGESGGPLSAPEMDGLAYAPNRMIIKNAEMEITVGSTDAAIDRITGIAAQYGGYLAGVRTWYENGYKEATLSIGVPSQSFEQVLRRVRGVADRVEREAATGQDVTDQYVDLESQLRNLEATSERIRSFLDRAETVEEALRVNDELGQILEQIEVIKGKMNYLAESAAFSILTVEIRQPSSTPTPTLPPTRTPTPTPVPPTPTSTPVIWQPSQTYERAGNTLKAVGRFTWEALIWVGVALLPIVGIPLAAASLIVWAVRRRDGQ